LTFVLFPSKAPIVAYEVEIEAGLFPQPLKQSPPSTPHCVGVRVQNLTG